MTREFENWITSNKERLCDDAKGLFLDSIKCLKSGIDRPAFLLAYQGMMVTIREALKSGKAPTGYTEGEWTNLLAKISREDSWDSSVFELIKKGPTVNGATIIKEAPLHMSDNVREQFSYWRIHRNICAHYRNEPFIKAHVLSLYSFIQEYLLRITVTGGLQVVLDQLRRYCDPTKTPDDEDIIPLLDESIARVSVNEMSTFLMEAVKIVGRSPRKDCIAFLDDILTLTDEKFESLKSATYDFIEAHTELLYHIIGNNPEHVLTFCDSKEKIYEFLHDGIYQLRQNQFSVIAQLIEAHRIEDDDLRELFQTMQSDMYRYNKWLLIESENIRHMLVANGYFDLFIQKYLTSKKINNICELRPLCYKTDFYISHMSAMPITIDIVIKLVEIFGSGKACPYTLAERFKEELLKDKDFSAKIKNVAAESQIELPVNWIN